MVGGAVRYRRLGDDDFDEKAFVAAKLNAAFSRDPVAVARRKATWETLDPVVQIIGFTFLGLIAIRAVKSLL